MNDVIISSVPPSEEVCEAVAALEMRCFSDPWSRESMISLCRCDTSTVFVAFSGDSVVGYAAVIVAADEGQLTHLAVAEEYRRRGIGASLLDAVKADAAGKGLTLYLEVRESNADARSLYLRCGFTVTGRRRAYYKNPAEDAILMYLPPLTGI